MQFFTMTEFTTKYSEYSTAEIPTWYIEAASEMIFSYIGLRYRDASWDTTSVPFAIKNASMEQMRFMLDHDIPLVDFNQHVKVGSMEADLISDYSSLAIRILANNGYLYRGNPIQTNMGLNIPFGN